MEFFFLFVKISLIGNGQTQKAIWVVRIGKLGPTWRNPIMGSPEILHSTMFWGSLIQHATLWEKPWQKNDQKTYQTRASTETSCYRTAQNHGKAMLERVPHQAHLWRRGTQRQVPLSLIGQLNHLTTSTNPSRPCPHLLFQRFRRTFFWCSSSTWVWCHRVPIIESSKSTDAGI